MPSRSIIRTGVGPHREPGNRFPAMAAAINVLAARAARVQSRRNLSRSLSPKLDHSHSITRFDRSRTGPLALTSVRKADVERVLDAQDEWDVPLRKRHHPGRADELPISNQSGDGALAKDGAEAGQKGAPLSRGGGPGSAEDVPHHRNGD